ncbi:36996_t:CDS:2, partial [Racocetra persica]
MATQNLVLVVTGASAGIGSGIVLVAIQNGARVIGCSRSSEKLETLKNEVIKRGYSVDSFNYVVGDASNKDVAKTTIEKAIELYGRIDALVNNVAEVDVGDRLSNMDFDKFVRMYEVNIFTAFYWIQMALPHLKEVNGKVINISSSSSVTARVGNSAYATYAALNMLTACLAEEEKEIQTIAICPGPVFTESLEANYSKRDENIAPYFKAFQEKYSIKEFRERSFHPEDTGHYVWGLITNFPTEFNGKFVLSTEPSLA